MSLHGKLEQPQLIRNSKNPFYLQDQPGGTQSTGWLGAWDAASSAYAVAAEDAADIVAAVNFARQHKLRLVIKGTGHDYLGRSNAPGSLLVWTHKMRRISIHDAFVPRGCDKTASSPAVTLEAGTRWLEAYQEVTVSHGRYVQGGGCTSVGAVGGFLQGGGFGSWSKKYGIAAASMLEAEVVTADGKVLVATGCQNQDLFWALRGGGGGTFGIVTKATLRTHPLPNYFGVVDGSIVAKNDAAFEELLERFLLFYRERLSNEHWGEQVRARRNNSLQLSLNFEGMTAKEAEQVWQPFRDWIDRNANTFTIKVNFVQFPAGRVWDQAFLEQHVPSAIKKDERTDQPGTRFWWAGDGDQVSTYWYTYQSRWIPLELFEGKAGAAAEAVQRGRETSMNPAVFKAAAVVIVAASAPGYPGVAGHEPNKVEGETARAGVAAAMKLIRDATPGTGTYVNETDYFEPNWQQEFWGENYERLSKIKQKYDPEDLFFCHHCVGSERWSTGGFCKSAP